MILLVLKALYFFLPVYAANMAPVFAQRLGLPLHQPISARFFGEHKTWRGYIFGYLVALLVVFVQELLASQHFEIVNRISIVDYQNTSILLLAFAFGVGALTGDLVKSFIKRCLHIKPSAAWFPLDQLDFVIGALVFLYPIYRPPLHVVIVLLIITPGLHLATNAIAYRLGLKSVWW